MPTSMSSPRAVGIDFGTTNSVIAVPGESGDSQLVNFATPDGEAAVFRSALCFWEEEARLGGLGHAAGPWAIAEYLDFPLGCRFVQSFKSVAANPAFEQASLFDRRLRFEDMGQIFLRHLLTHAGGQLANLPDRIIIGRPVRYVGAKPDPALARQRYDAMFALLGRPVHYVYEPLGAAYGFAAQLGKPTTLLVADFGGGTSDFSVVRVEAPGAARRCTALGSAGIGIAGDRFDYRIMDQLVLPMLGKGGSYRSFDKVLEIPGGHFNDFADWSRLALMRNRKTMDALARLQRSALDPAAIGRMIAVIDHEQGYPLYEAVGTLKRALSTADNATFRFDGPDLSIEAEVSRAEFERWIAPDLASIDATIDTVLAKAGVTADAIDHVFMTGGSSLIPAMRRLFERRFGASRIESGNELTSIAHGLALIGGDPNVEEWTAPLEDMA